MNRIICEDALAVVETLGEFDYMVTDPPYPTGGESSMKSKSSVKQSREMIDAMAQSFIAAVIQRVPRRSPFASWTFCDWRQISFLSSIYRAMGLDKQSCIVWDKKASNFSALYHPCHEMILFAADGVAAKSYLGKDLVACSKPSAKGKTHPFEKPPRLVEELCRPFPKGRVIDPFCGTGGLLVGCRALGWDVVGIDISEDFCAVAEKRINGGVA